MARTPVMTERGEEVVETGRGLVGKIEGDGSKRNVRVEIQNPTLRMPVAGWVDTVGNPGTWDIINAANLERREVEYRIVVHRKDGVDFARPIAELQNTEKVRDFVFAGWPTGQPAASAPAAPAPTQPPLEAPANGGGWSPAVQEASRRADEQETRPGVLLEEGKPWEATNSDGSPNLGSYSAMACIGLAELAWETLMPKAGAAALEQVDWKRIEALAAYLLEMADEVQAQLRRDRRVQRLDASHTRARGAIRTVLETWPVPLDADAAGRQAWRGAVVAAAAGLCRVGVKLDTASPRA